MKPIATFPFHPVASSLGHFGNNAQLRDARFSLHARVDSVNFSTCGEAACGCRFLPCERTRQNNRSNIFGDTARARSAWNKTTGSAEVAPAAGSLSWVAHRDQTSEDCVPLDHSSGPRSEFT